MSSIVKVCDKVLGNNYVCAGLSLFAFYQSAVVWPNAIKNPVPLLVATVAGGFFYSLLEKNVIRNSQYTQKLQDRNTLRSAAVFFGLTGNPVTQMVDKLLAIIFASLPPTTHLKVGFSTGFFATQLYYQFNDCNKN